MRARIKVKNSLQVSKVECGMKFCLLLFWILGLLLLSAARQYTRFKIASATYLSAKVCTVHYCYIKSYSRTVSAFNLGFTLHRPLVKPFFVR